MKSALVGVVGVVPVVEVGSEWGRETGLRGLISSLCLFSDNLSHSAMNTLYTRGGRSFPELPVMSSYFVRSKRPVSIPAQVS